MFTMRNVDVMSTKFAMILNKNKLKKTTTTVQQNTTQHNDIKLKQTKQ